MASNYMTSDGVDLDSRYLGINAKAKSASAADNATYATSAGKANSATTATTASKLSGGFSGISLGTAISFYSSKRNPYTFPNSGIAWMKYAGDEGETAEIVVDGYSLVSDFAGTSGKATVYATTVVKKGWTVSGPSGRFYPFA